MEDSFIHREERDKLFAVWVADQMGDGAPPHYADDLMEFAFGRDATDMIARAQGDLHNHGVALADIKIQKAFDQCGTQAQSAMFLLSR